MEKVNYNEYHNLSEIFEQHDVVLFMNGTPDAPFCAYGKQQVQY